MTWDEEWAEDDEEYLEVRGRVSTQTHRAYLLIGPDLSETWVPKSVSQLEPDGTLWVKEWFVSKEGLPR